jgi:hypothetical protein
LVLAKIEEQSFCENGPGGEIRILFDRVPVSHETLDFLQNLDFLNSAKGNNMSKSEKGEPIFVWKSLKKIAYAGPIRLTLETDCVLSRLAHSSSHEVLSTLIFQHDLEATACMSYTSFRSDMNSFTTTRLS